MLLQSVGHLVPAPEHRDLNRWSSDAVIATWMGQVDVEPPESGKSGTMDRFPAPLLSLALSPLAEIA
ncbi:MAG: hypothetical protein QOG75_5627 [Mycobacterium sp.]|jgi:hypothetical protein|nr:hypothetical protein [Mycobacterium sp.]